jgi:hypothetical protein
LSFAFGIHFAVSEMTGHGILLRTDRRCTYSRFRG